MRADRLIAILLLLQQREQVTAVEVARELEVSERTARRDLVGGWSEEDRAAAARALGQAALELLGRYAVRRGRANVAGMCVTAFEPMRTEPPVDGVTRAMLGAGVRVLVPLTLERPRLDWADLAVRLCDVRYGIGSDGVLEVVAAEGDEADDVDQQPRRQVDEPAEDGAIPIAGQTAEDPELDDDASQQEAKQRRQPRPPGEGVQVRGDGVERVPCGPVGEDRRDDDARPAREAVAGEDVPEGAADLLRVRRSLVRLRLERGLVQRLVEPERDLQLGAAE